MTCKSDGRYVVYRSHYGKRPTLSLIEQHKEIYLRESLKEIPDIIRTKILANKGEVIGIGAHPKDFALHQELYNYNQIYDAFECNEEVNLDLSALLIVKDVMEDLKIKQVRYIYSYAGNTTGFLAKFI